MFRLHYPHWWVIVVLSLLAHGCPVQAIVFAFGLDERTASDWHERTGRHGQRVQKEWVCQGRVATGQVQADELCAKAQQGTVWIATAMCVFTRLFIWGEVGAERNTALVHRLAHSSAGLALLDRLCLQLLSCSCYFARHSRHGRWYYP